mgnify:CR=1 FL=1
MTLLKKLRIKSKHHKRWRHGCDEHGFHRKEFVRLRKEVKYDIDLAYKAYILNVEETVRNDPAKLWGFIKNKSKHLPPASLTTNGNMLNNPDDIANAFALFFKSVYRKSLPTQNICQSASSESSNNPQENPFFLSKIKIIDIESAIKKTKIEKFSRTG